jgi:hypothetical protein
LTLSFENDILKKIGIIYTRLPTRLASWLQRAMMVGSWFRRSQSFGAEMGTSSRPSGLDRISRLKGLFKSSIS